MIKNEDLLIKPYGIYFEWRNKSLSWIWTEDFRYIWTYSRSCSYIPLSHSRRTLLLKTLGACVAGLRQSFCVSVTVLAATYILCKSQRRWCKVPYSISNVCIVWISERWKRFVLQFWRHLACYCWLSRYLMGSWQDTKCIASDSELVPLELLLTNYCHRRRKKISLEGPNWR